MDNHCTPGRKQMLKKLAEEGRWEELSQMKMALIRGSSRALWMFKDQRGGNAMSREAYYIEELQLARP